MIVAVKTVLSVVSYIEVRPSVVVIIGNHTSISPPEIGHVGLLRYICKGSVVIVMKQRCVRRIGLPGKRIIIRSVYEIDIQPAVIVVIQQADAWPFLLQNKFLLRSSSCVMPASTS